MPYMGTLRNSTSTSTIERREAQSDVEALTVVQDTWVTYRACGGLMDDPDNGLKQITVQALADRLSVHRDTLYKWEKSIPDFWDRVATRRAEIFTTERIGRVWNGLFLQAAKGNPKAAEMVLSHFSDYVPPTQKVEHGVSDNVADLLSQARARRPVVNNEVAQPVIDATIVDKPVDSGDNVAKLPTPTHSYPLNDSVLKPKSNDSLVSKWG